MTAEKRAAESSPQRVEPEVTRWERFSFSSMRFVLRCIFKVVGLNGLYGLSRSFAWMEYAINHKRRKRVRRMQRVAFDEDTPKHVRSKWVREHFMRLRCDKVFYLIFDMLTQEQLAPCFEIVNQKVLDEALARGKG
ncbi:MAG: hypothetical protein GXP29_09905, partial [Planctomycetes bacterium]|nr:hypothetical protein [Planctomycetota bacterium]